eukprot:scaffold58057_cov86-Phaeocystis_antarctica.AAC.3
MLQDGVPNASILQDAVDGDVRIEVRVKVGRELGNDRDELGVGEDGEEHSDVHSGIAHVPRCAAAATAATARLAATTAGPSAASGGLLHELSALLQSGEGEGNAIGGRRVRGSQGREPTLQVVVELCSRRDQAERRGRAHLGANSEEEHRVVRDHGEDLVDRDCKCNRSRGRASEGTHTGQSSSRRGGRKVGHLQRGRQKRDCQSAKEFGPTDVGKSGDDRALLRGERRDEEALEHRDAAPSRALAREETRPPNELELGEDDERAAPREQHAEGDTAKPGGRERHPNIHRSWEVAAREVVRVAPNDHEAGEGNDENHGLLDA